MDALDTLAGILDDAVDLRLKREIEFERNLIVADVDSNSKIFAMKTLEAGHVDVNAKLIFQGVQSGVGTEDIYYELIDGNYLSVAITRENNDLVSMLLSQGCSISKSVKYYSYKENVKIGPLEADNQATYANIIGNQQVNETIKNMMEKGHSQPSLPSITSKLVELQEIFPPSEENDRILKLLRSFFEIRSSETSKPTRDDISMSIVEFCISSIKNRNLKANNASSSSSTQSSPPS